MTAIVQDASRDGWFVAVRSCDAQRLSRRARSSHRSIRQSLEEFAE